MTKTEIADLLGEREARVRLLDWSRLAQEGAIVKLHITRWRAQSRLTLVDLGIVTRDKAEADAWGKLLNLGSRLLLPRRVVERLDNLDNLARGALRECSLETAWGRFVPRQRYADWSARNGALEAQYRAFAREVAEQWPSLIEEVRGDYLRLAQINYDRLVAAGARLTDGRADWIVRFVQGAVAQTVTAEAFLASLSYDWDTEYVPLRMGGGDTPEQQQAIRDALEADIRRTDTRRAAESLERFVSDVQADVRERVYEATVDVLGALKKGKGSLPRNSTRQLKHLVDQVARLKFWPDDELDKGLAEIARLVAIPSEKRPAKDLRVTLRKLGSESRLVLLELDRAPARSGRAAGIPDEPAELAKIARRSARDGAFDAPAPIAPRTNGRTPRAMPLMDWR